MKIEYINLCKYVCVYSQNCQDPPMPHTSWCEFDCILKLCIHIYI
jgi:hypothetical protein